MRNFLIDSLGLAGFGAMNYGLYLKFGLADALISAGGLLLLLALAGARAAKRRNESKGAA
ncbi:hypothetical protein HLV39_12380 [Marinobacter adhaerens]|uniref:Uncharacterized protein n=1 Tax=Marinobacter adhaerens TaxID=1033846 RepID=A0A851I2F6_9GAMM|nr:hypothetical protein [Marinobacter adhaerens]NWN92288.1 hypothetical protein [Marinobacter adhaerens]